MSSVASHLNGSISSNLSIQLDEYSRTGGYRGSSIVATLNKHGAESLLTRRVSFGDDDDDDDNEEHFEQPPDSIDPVVLVGSYVKFPPSSSRSRKQPSGRLSKVLQQHNQSSSSLTIRPDLAVSPLTASSYQTLERQYDQDTWRMHNRIAASRIERQSYMQQSRKGSQVDSAAMLNGKNGIPGLNEVSDDSKGTNNYEGEDDDDEDALCIFDFDE